METVFEQYLTRTPHENICYVRKDCPWGSAGQFVVMHHNTNIFSTQSFDTFGEAIEHSMKLKYGRM